MEYSDNENGSDSDDLVDELLGPESLFDQQADEDGHEGGDEDEDKPENNDKIKEKAEKKLKPKKTIKNPRITLNVDTLKGENGLGALKKLFKDFKFEENGHEQEDLTKIMRILQHWMCFKLFPKYDFESCMEHLEKLGKKRAVQTLLKKFRMGIDDWGENKSDNENDNKMEITEEPNERNTIFDLLLNEQMVNTDSDSDLNQSDFTQTQNDVAQNQQLPNETIQTLTPEQLERIAENKRLAEIKRSLRMNGQVVDTNLDTNNIKNSEILLEKMNLKESSN